MSHKLNIVMYHYVRDLQNSRYPNIKGLDYNLFKKQIEFFEQAFHGLDKLETGIQNFRGNSGFFYEYELKNILELIPLCGSRLQTVAYCGDVETFMPLLEAGIRGIDRLIPIGRTMEFDYIWDGYNLAERLTRVIGG